MLDIVNPMNTPKNILIRAVRSNIGETARKKALDEVKHLCDEYSLNPKLAVLLQIL